MRDAGLDHPNQNHRHHLLRANDPLPLLIGEMIDMKKEMSLGT